MDLISDEKPDVLHIQETLLPKQRNFDLMNYNGLCNPRHTNYRAREGVAIFIQETILYQKFIRNTTLQAMSAKINIRRDMTIISVYNSRKHDIRENLISALFQYLPKPVLLTGVFNSYHQLEGNPANDYRRCQVLSFNNKTSLIF